MTVNKKIKQRKCPFGKVELCDSYGNCGDCTWHKVIEKYEKKIKKLQTNTIKSQVEILKGLEDKSYYGYNDTRCVNMADIYKLIKKTEQ